MSNNPNWPKISLTKITFGFNKGILKQIFWNGWKKEINIRLNISRKISEIKLQQHSHKSRSVSLNVFLNNELFLFITIIIYNLCDDASDSILCAAVKVLKCWKSEHIRCLFNLPNPSCSNVFINFFAWKELNKWEY